MDTYKKMLKYIKPYLKTFIIGIIFLIIAGVIDLLFPILLRYLIDDVLLSGDNELLNYIALSAIIMFFIKGLFNYGQVSLLSSMGEKLITDLRNDLYEYLQGLSLSFFEKRKTGDLISRMTNDINIIQASITSGIPGLVIQPLKVLITVIILIYFNWKLSLVALLLFPLVGFALNKFGKKMRSVSNKIQDKVGIITTILQETISGIKIVKAFSMEEKEVNRFIKANKKTLNANLKGVQIKAFLSPVIELILAMGAAVFFWYGGHLVISGELEPGKLIAFLTYMMMLMSPINILSENYNLFQKAVGAADRIFEIFQVDEREKDAQDAVDIKNIEGRVVFRNVYFSYNKEEKILNDINLIANPGEMVALVGHSGAGKSTLVNLIPRFYELNQGEILIDGIDIKGIKLKSLRHQIGIVPQDIILFQGTVLDNILYGSRNKNKEEVIEAARKANAHDFIISFKKGYETEVGERGVSLSGGQKQRISIARAILTDPKILILDEATSSLDTKSEALVQEALERLMKDKTTFVIAHRLSTVINADRIIVLEKGKIVEHGTHEDLINKKSYYYRLYQTQI